MANPYETPTTVQHAQNVPNWYVLFCKAYWPMWWTGTTLIAGSWFNIVSPTVGWIGFGLAGAASLGAYVLPSMAGFKSEDYVALDSRLLDSKGEAYSDALQRFSKGATLIYDGVAFGLRPNNEIASAIAAPSRNICEADAGEVADHAKNTFDTLSASSPEFASIVSGRTFRISIMSNMDAGALELFRVVDGRVETRG